MNFILLKEKFRILNKLNIYRLINCILIQTGYFLSYITKKNITPGFPYAITYEPTNFCNLKCPECPTGKGELKRNKGIASIDRYKNIIDQVKKHTFYLNLYFQGEPFINPELYEMIHYASKSKIFTVISTNGHFITEEIAQKIIKAGLGKIIFSLDGISQESYEQYRKGGDFNKVIESIKNLIHKRKELKYSNPVVILQCLALASNENYLKEIVKYGKELGVDRVEIKTAQFYNLDNKENSLVPKMNTYSRYVKNNIGQWKIKNNLPDKCFLLWSSCVITWDGIVVPCCFDKDAQHSYGKIDNQNFSKIWKSNKAKKFREMILKNRKKIDICNNCTQGLKV